MCHLPGNVYMLNEVNFYIQILLDESYMRDAPNGIRSNSLATTAVKTPIQVFNSPKTDTKSLSYLPRSLPPKKHSLKQNVIMLYIISMLLSSIERQKTHFVIENNVNGNGFCSRCSTLEGCK